MSSIGFDSLPGQVTTRITMHGISFNVLVVGQTGIGKTTLINSLFDFEYGDSPDIVREITDVELRIKEIRPHNKIKLTIIETKGFDNQLDKSKSFKPIVDYVTSRYDDHLKDELRVHDTRYNDMSDARIHCCIYMISPVGHGLRPIDLVTMKELDKRVCLIPVIGKSDMLTKHEVMLLKERIRQDITANSIEVYSSHPYSWPLAVAASRHVNSENGKRQRVYPWGKMLIEKDSEFSQLRDLILRSHMLSLKETTDRVHYEKFRKENMSSFTSIKV